MSNGIELIERVGDQVPGLLNSPKIDGYFKRVMVDRLAEENSSDTISHIFSNAYKAIKLFSDPSFLPKDNQLSKILCLGKVQSGKTAFFTASLALAFDNGYSLAFLIGGTKNKLKEQNYDRAELEFSNNQKVIVHELDADYQDNIDAEIARGVKVIIVALKNASQNVNLGAIKTLVKAHSNIPMVVIDDEGDEYTPGSPKSKCHRGSKTHDAIGEIIYTPKICTYLSVTATPQANFLISTIDEMSPDYAVLVQPGDGYTGGNAFHDIMANPHTIGIADSDDFADSIPDSFLKALYFFIFAACLKRSEGDLKPYSMLVHPSYLTTVQGVVASKIKDCFDGIKRILMNKSDISYPDALEKIRQASLEYTSMNKGKMVNFDLIESSLPDVLDQIVLFEFNVSFEGQQSLLNEKDDKSLYKIYVGGNMLGRGLTIKNLVVTYIYRDSKITAIDTLYQRARWFGYKQSYFDICRVYMTDELKRKFITTVENENDLWTAVSSFLLTKMNIKEFPRVFSLNDTSGKMILTRKTVSNTVVLERINPGYQYDKAILMSGEERQSNRQLFADYLKSHEQFGQEQDFSSSGGQTHFIIDTTYSDFYYSFLAKYNFPKGSVFGLLGFTRILGQIHDGKMSDKINIIVMRYKKGEFRSALGPVGAETNIKELPQGYDEGSGYCGDKELTGYYDKVHFQIHLVYIDQNHPELAFPLLAFNNPITVDSIKYVTGDNVYGGI
jgi:hypothetical protein